MLRQEHNYDLLEHLLEYSREPKPTVLVSTASGYIQIYLFSCHPSGLPNVPNCLVYHYDKMVRIWITGW